MQRWIPEVSIARKPPVDREVASTSLETVVPQILRTVWTRDWIVGDIEVCGPLVYEHRRVQGSIC